MAHIVTGCLKGQRRGVSSTNPKGALTSPHGAWTLPAPGKVPGTMAPVPHSYCGLGQALSLWLLLTPDSGGAVF